MYAIDTSTGLVVPAVQCPSPNFDERPANTPIDLLVIHCISLPPGEFGTGRIEKFFCNALDSSEHPYFAEISALEVSSHLLIDRAGDVVQFVPLHKRAWHAGDSEFQGRSRCNDFSIGIELEGTDDSAFSDEQYTTLIGMIQALRSTYPGLTNAPVIGHSDIAPGRKTDPGPEFDWTRLGACSPENTGPRGEIDSYGKIRR